MRHRLQYPEISCYGSCTSAVFHSGQYPFDTGENIVQRTVDFRKKIIRPTSQCGLAVFGEITIGKYDKRCIPVHYPDLLYQFQAILAEQTEVDENEMG